MRLLATICCLGLVLAVTPAFAQGHESVFPDLSGDDLYQAVVEAYTPGYVLDFSRARDTLFGRIYRTAGDSLECVYSGWSVHLPPGEDPTQAAYQNGFGINTEHTWPRANGTDNDPARSDMHHLYPTRADVNADRNNFPFLEIDDNLTDRWYVQDQQTSLPPANNRDAYSELLLNTGFEPRESHKGNVARAMFYVHTIYRGPTQAAASGFFAGMQEDLCAWHVQDPVDADEWNRTWMIASHQDETPNPFVIDCTLAARMYCPEWLDENCITSAGAPSLEGFKVGLMGPNPSHGNLRVRTELPVGGHLQWRWHDAQGRTHAHISVRVGAGTRDWQFALPYAGYWYGEVVLETSSGRYRQIIPAVVMP